MELNNYYLLNNNYFFNVNSNFIKDMKSLVNKFQIGAIREKKKKGKRKAV